MSLPDLFNHLTLLRPANIQQLLNEQRQQATDGCSAVHQPQLLQRLEAALAEGEKAAASLQHDGSSWGATKLRLNTHRQVFDLFLASMSTYRPLLLRIKTVYDAALEDAMASASDYAYLQAELSAMPHRHAEAVVAAKQDAEAAAAAMHDELLNKLAELEQQAQQVERECGAAEEQLEHYRKHVMGARRELDQLEVSNRRAYKELLEQSSWGLLGSITQQSAPVQAASLASSLA